MTDRTFFSQTTGRWNWDRAPRITAAVHDGLEGLINSGGSLSREVLKTFMANQGEVQQETALRQIYLLRQFGAVIFIRDKVQILPRGRELFEALD